MGRRRQRPRDMDLADRREAAAAKQEAAFRTHLVTFLVTGLFLLTLNLLTSPTSLWFYWPLFFWGWAVVIHAFTTYGVDAPARVMALLRTFVSGGGTTTQDRSRTDPSAPLRSPTASVEEIEERVRRLWRIARQIPEGPVRDQAFRISAAADRVAEVMAADRTDPGTVAWFDDRLLAPTETMLTHYVRLRTREVPGADSTLRRVEDESLPAIEARLDALYDQLHRGAVVDLAVASEMLEFELPERRVSG
jgi:hypothetical protein